MIRDVNLYQLSGGHLDKSGFDLLVGTGGSVIASSIPIKADIGRHKLVIHFKGDDYSFARPYSCERAFPAKKKKGKKDETLDSRCYKLTFNNPHDSEKPVFRFVSLTKWQNLRFSIYRAVSWLGTKDNFLWLVNLVVLILNIIAFLCLQ